MLNCIDARRGAVRWLIPALWVPALMVVLACAWHSAFADTKHRAQVNDDGTLLVRGRTVHLYGIHIPSTDRICRRSIRPVKCAPRAALALDFKIDSFVSCERRGEHPAGGVIALCRVRDTDLSAYLLARGWALALPDAPFAYSALERIARSRGLGVWGFAIGEQ